ncbi:LytS family sensor histidine kinase [Pedobacter jejuensis]|uniref:Sensor histidine kinase n=1 Tax=Pedobacter jejuensis TaxID=1268550 RepID=A0A3N0BWR8_9SPHI|nr:hypothetical protein [Pedobacter jejuensis]RNL54173.1 hypothetical protein D7004_08760 [Pedobacter jejuensis]
MNLELAYAPDTTELSFIPLVLITVLENMIKHGDLSGSAGHSSLDIFIDDNNLIIASRNKILSTPPSYGLSSGLDNIKNRLAFAYGNDYSLEHFIDEDNYFELTIKVRITAIKQNQISSEISSMVSN